MKDEKMKVDIKLANMEKIIRIFLITLVSFNDDANSWSLFGLQEMMVNSA